MNECAAKWTQRKSQCNAKDSPVYLVFSDPPPLHPHTPGHSLSLARRPLKSFLVLLCFCGDPGCFTGLGSPTCPSCTCLAFSEEGGTSGRGDRWEALAAE